MKLPALFNPVITLLPALLYQAASGAKVPGFKTPFLAAIARAVAAATKETTATAIFLPVFFYGALFLRTSDNLTFLSIRQSLARHHLP